MAQDGSWAGDTAVSWDACTHAYRAYLDNPSSCHGYNSSTGGYTDAATATNRETYFRGALVPWSLTRNVQLVRTGGYIRTTSPDIVRALPPE